VTIRTVSQLEVKTLFIALLVGVAHLVSGILVFHKPEAAFAAPTAMLQVIAEWLGIFGSGAVGATLIVAGALAIIGSTASFSRRVHVWLFIPQEALLLLQLYSISMALIMGAYPDGYIPPEGAWFILTDQIWAFIFAVSHSLWLAVFIFGGARGGDS
jgi:hypothetical protein